MSVVPLGFVFYMQFCQLIFWPESFCRQDSLGCWCCERD